MAIALGGIAVSGLYQASIRSLNVHSNQADSKSKARSANFAVLFAVTNILIILLNIWWKMLKKISNAE
ncbi:MAG: hypothetical protein ABR985_19635 [Methanotrichaceae archaeon]